MRDAEQVDLLRDEPHHARDAGLLTLTFALAHCTSTWFYCAMRMRMRMSATAVGLGIPDPADRQMDRDATRVLLLIEVSL